MAALLPKVRQHHYNPPDARPHSRTGPGVWHFELEGRESPANNNGMKVMRHARHANRVMRIEGTLAVAGVGSGVLLWSQAAHLAGYGFGAAAFLSLGGIQSGVRALRAYNRYSRGTEGEDAVLHALCGLPEGYTAIANFVAPGTRQGDLDLLILGPAGVLVVEIKSYQGRYACHGDAWFAVHPDGSRQPLRGSVSRQLKRGRKAVAHYLVDCDVSVPVHAAAVFRPGVQLELIHPTVPIIMQDALCAHILGLPPAPRVVGTAEVEGLFAPAGRAILSPPRAATLPSEGRVGGGG